MKGAFPFQRPTLYAKVLLFLLTLLFKTVKNFSVKIGALRRKSPFHIQSHFCFVLSCNVAPYFQLKKNCFLYLIYEHFWINACFGFSSPHINNNKKFAYCFFLAEWLSHSFNWKILRKKKRGRRPCCPPIFWLLKKATETFILLRTFSLVKNIRNLRINLRNELLYSYVLLRIWGGSPHRQYLALYTKA